MKLQFCNANPKVCFCLRLKRKNKHWGAWQGDQSLNSMFIYTFCTHVPFKVRIMFFKGEEALWSKRMFLFLTHQKTIKSCWLVIFFWNVCDVFLIWGNIRDKFCFRSIHTAAAGSVNSQIGAQIYESFLVDLIELLISWDQSELDLCSDSPNVLIFSSVPN